MKRTTGCFASAVLIALCAFAVPNTRAMPGIPGGDVYFWRTHYRPDERIVVSETAHLTGWLYGQKVSALLNLHSEQRVTRVLNGSAKLVERMYQAGLHGVTADGRSIDQPFSAEDEFAFRVTDRGYAEIHRNADAVSGHARLQGVFDFLRSACAPDSPVALGEVFHSEIPMALSASGKVDMRCSVSADRRVESGTELTVDGFGQLILSGPKVRGGRPVEITGRWVLDPVTGRVLRSDFLVQNWPAAAELTGGLQTLDIQYHSEYTPAAISSPANR
jgi:hypothetical protein